MTTNGKTTATASPVNNMLEAMQDASTKMMPGVGPEWFETMSNVGNEMLAFMSERVKQDVQTQKDLLQAKGIAEIQQIQADFIKRTMNDYTTEMAKLMDFGKPHGNHATPV
jgi:hypothetical protein